MPEYIARISYGKDSLKMLDVIFSRNLPLDRITTTDVWATDTVSANLPPMEEFKARMDERIWNLYRVDVEHLCARNKDGTKRTYEQMFYHVPVRRSQNGQVERERDGLRPGSILGFPDLWNPWCQAGLKRNAKPQSAGDDYRIPTQHRIQLLPEAQVGIGCNSRIPRVWSSMVPRGTQISSSDPKDSQHRYPRGAESSRSTRSRHPSPRSAPRGAGKEISWNTLASPLTSLPGSHN